MIRLALLLTSVLLATSSILAAPAPTYRPKPLTRASLVGLWRATWGATPCTVELRADGSYHCLYCERVYVGSWALLDDGRLAIQEQPADSDHPCQPVPYYFRYDSRAECWVAGPCLLALVSRVRR